MAESDIQTTRRERLRQLIEDRFGGRQSALVEEIGINQGELSGLLKTKSFGEKKARSLEEQLKLPSKWLDQRITVVPDRQQEWDKLVWLWEHADNEVRVMLGLLTGAMYDKKRRELDKQKASDERRVSGSPSNRSQPSDPGGVERHHPLSHDE